MDEVSKLIARLEAQVNGVVDVPAAIAMLVRRAVEQEIDPYITLGVLVESIAHTLALTIPEQKKIETAKGVAHLLLDRFAAQGLIH